MIVFLFKTNYKILKISELKYKSGYLLIIILKKLYLNVSGNKNKHIKYPNFQVATLLTLQSHMINQRLFSKFQNVYLIFTMVQT